MRPKSTPKSSGRWRSYRGSTKPNLDLSFVNVNGNYIPNSPQCKNLVNNLRKSTINLSTYSKVNIEMIQQKIEEKNKEKEELTNIVIGLKDEIKKITEEKCLIEDERRKYIKDISRSEGGRGRGGEKNKGRRKEQGVIFTHLTHFQTASVCVCVCVCVCVYVCVCLGFGNRYASIFFFFKLAGEVKGVIGGA